MPQQQLNIQDEVKQQLPSKNLSACVMVAAFCVGVGYGLIQHPANAGDLNHAEVTLVLDTSLEPVVASPLLSVNFEHERAHQPRLVLAKANIKTKLTMVDSQVGLSRKSVKPPMQRVTKTLSNSQQASHEYHRAIAYVQKGRIAESLDMLKKTLMSDPAHDDARLMLVGLLIDNQKRDEAVNVLQEGLMIAPNQVVYAETLARLQLDAGLLAPALQTLQGSLVYGQHASYQVLLANILQRLGNHVDASQHFQQAIQTGANLPAHWIGWAVSLQALGRNAEAKQAYRHVQRANLSPELGLFVSQRVKQLQ